MTQGNDAVRALTIQLFAVEHLLCEMRATMLLGFSAEQRQAITEASLEALSHQTFPGMDPAQADHLAAEYQDALRQLLEKADHMAAALQARLDRLKPR